MSVEKFELNGEYQVTLEDGFKMSIQRNNKEWMSCSELSGNNIMLALIQEVLDQKELLKEAFLEGMNARYYADKNSVPHEDVYDQWVEFKTTESL